MAANELTYAAIAPVLKSIEENGARILEGIASDESLDMQDEVVPADQLEKSYPYLQQWGTVNFDHGTEPIGEVLDVRPISAEEAAQEFGVDLTGRGTYVKCKVFPLEGNKLAPDDLRRVHYLMDSGARLGMSLDGVAVRKGNGIQKMLASKVAVTTQPVNPNAAARVVKSVAAAFELADGADENDCPQIIIAPPYDLQKAMETGHSVNPATMTGAGPLQRESLEGKTRGRNRGSAAAGPGGKCVCPNCGNEVEHETNTPCDERECPECGALMDRDEAIRPELKKALAVLRNVGPAGEAGDRQPLS